MTQARADATRITVAPEQLTDPQAMARYAEAQTRLTMTLQRLQEAYPQLQSQQNFATLMSQLEGTENRVTIAVRMRVRFETMAEPLLLNGRKRT